MLSLSFHDGGPRNLFSPQQEPFMYLLMWWFTDSLSVAVDLNSNQIPVYAIPLQEPRTLIMSLGSGCSCSKENICSACTALSSHPNMKCDDKDLAKFI